MPSLLLMLVRLYSTMTASTPAQNTTTTTTRSNADIMAFTVFAICWLTDTLATPSSLLAAAPAMLGFFPSRTDT